MYIFLLKIIYIYIYLYLYININIYIYAFSPNFCILLQCVFGSFPNSKYLMFTFDPVYYQFTNWMGGKCFAPFFLSVGINLLVPRHAGRYSAAVAHCKFNQF